MWLLLTSLLAFGAEDSRISVEADAGLALPHAGLGVAPAVRVLAGVMVVPQVQIGVDLDWRLPGTLEATLRDDDVLSTVIVSTGQWVGAAGLRGDYLLSLTDALAIRSGITVGAARLSQRFRADYGVSRESRTSLWLRPEAAALIALGPGELSTGVHWSYVPNTLDTLGKGGSAVGLHGGYRLQF